MTGLVGLFGIVIELCEVLFKVRLDRVQIPEAWGMLPNIEEDWERRVQYLNQRSCSCGGWWFAGRVNALHGFPVRLLVWSAVEGSGLTFHSSCSYLTMREETDDAQNSRAPDPFIHSW